MPEWVPSNWIHWPDDAERAQGLIQSVAAVADDVSAPIEDGGLFTPPAMAQVVSLETALQNATGLGFDELVSLAGDVLMLVEATNPEEAVLAAADLVVGAVDAVVTVLELAGVALGAATAIPLVGQAFGAVMDILTGIIDAVEAKKQAQAAKLAWCTKFWRNELYAGCKHRLELMRPAPTSPKGLTPADMFRPVSYTYEGWRKQVTGDEPNAYLYRLRHTGMLPMTPASLYVMLCYGDTEGFMHEMEKPGGGGAGYATNFDFFWETFYQKTGDTHVAVPQEMRAKMWQIIKGLFAQREDPTITLVPQATVDSGRSIYPLLMDMVRHLWIAGQKGWGYGINEKFVRYCDEWIQSHQQIWVPPCPHVGGQQQFAGYSYCGKWGTKVADLAIPFMDQIVSYHNLLRGPDFVDPDTGKWKVPRSMSGVNQPMRAIAAAVSQERKLNPLLSSGVLAEGRREALKKKRKRASAMKVAGLGALAAGIGLTGWHAWRTM